MLPYCKVLHPKLSHIALYSQFLLLDIVSKYILMSVLNI